MTVYDLASLQAIMGCAIKPRSRLYYIVFALIGLTIGMGFFTFIYGKGYSYLSSDSKACVNCHVMQDQFDSWRKSSHHAVTTCNSCHAPENIYLKYINKMDNGFFHSLKFTTGAYVEPLKIRKHNFKIAMSACFRCHGALVDSSLHQKSIEEGKACIHCHRNAGHNH